MVEGSPVFVFFVCLPGDPGSWGRPRAKAWVPDPVELGFAGS